MLLKLFLTFMQIGAVSFGGGYGMISLMREKCVPLWLTDEEFMSFIAISESTPGPISVNMATFVGSDQAGILGSACATLGLVLPSFIIILIIASVLKNLLKYKGVQAALSGIKAVVVGLILATSATMFMSIVCGFTAIGEGYNFDVMGVLVIAVVAIVALAYKKLRNKVISPIVLILISALLGVIIY